MAFSSTFIPFNHRNHLQSFTLCKSPSPLSSSFNNFSHGFLIFSPKNHSKHSQFLHIQTHITTHLETKTSVTKQEHSKPTRIQTIPDKIQHGSSSLRPEDGKSGKFSVENDIRVTKMKKIDSKSRENGTGHCYVRSKNENFPENTSKNRVFYVKMDNTGVKKEERGQLEREKRVKRFKTVNLDSPEAVLRLGLEMCSKQGDVMGVIGIYDLAKREGIKLEQYDYTVILYLCSSAATGVVQPARSGSRNRSSSKVDFSNNNSQNSPSLEEKGGFETVFQTLDGLIGLINGDCQTSSVRNIVRVGEDVKEYALKRGFEVFKEMVLDEVPMNEATLTSLARMAMSRVDGDMAFSMVKQMTDLGINPRLRSYSPALSVFCNIGNIEKAFEVEEHMLAHAVYPEEPELETLLKASIEGSRSDKVYYLLHKLRTSVGKVLPSTADLIEKWFKSRAASRIGKRKWDQDLINKTIENRGGGWHGQGWLGKGKWSVVRSFVGKDGLCKCCGEKLATIDLDPLETEKFAESVVKVATQREKNSSFENFQKWLDEYGPFEVVVDGANFGLFNQRRFKSSKVDTIVNGMRQMLPSKKWPLVVMSNKLVMGDRMAKELKRPLIEMWKNVDALYATPNGSNDDWYWLYAAIKFRCLIVTNDEMRDHLFQLLGNDFFPKWKERHQVRFYFSDKGPVYRLPPPCSVVIQESEKGHWHIPIASEQDSEEERTWLCVTRPQSSSKWQESINVAEGTEAHQLNAP